MLLLWGDRRKQLGKCGRHNIFFPEIASVCFFRSFLPFLICKQQLTLVSPVRISYLSDTQVRISIQKLFPTAQRPSFISLVTTSLSAMPIAQSLLTEGKHKKILHRFSICSICSLKSPKSQIGFFKVTSLLTVVMLCGLLPIYNVL